MFVGFRGFNGKIVVWVSWFQTKKKKEAVMAASKQSCGKEEDNEIVSRGKEAKFVLYHRRVFFKEIKGYMLRFIKNCSI